MDDGQQNPNLSFDELYEEAKSSVPVLDEVGKNMLADLQRANPSLLNDIEFESGPLKTLDRATAKIAGDYAGDHSQISDLVRGRIVVENADQVEALRNYLNENAQALGIEKTKDRFAKPSNTGFRDINMKVRLPNGHVAELRIEHRGLLNAAKHTHEPYEKVQEIERRMKREGRYLTEEEALERRRLFDEVRDIHGKPAAQDGLDRLLNEEGRAELNRFEVERVTPPLEAATDNRIAIDPNDIEMRETPSFSDRAADTLGDIGKRAGLVGGAVIGTAAAGITYVATGNEVEAAEVAFETIVPYGETALDVTEGDMEAAAHSATVETAANVGSLAGTVAGAATGAAIGSVVPVAGTAVGGVFGGIIGAVGGGVAVGTATDYVLENGQELTNKTMTIVDNAGDRISAATTRAKDYVSEEARGLWGSITSVFNDEANPETPEQVMVAEQNVDNGPNTELTEPAVFDSKQIIVAGLGGFSGPDATYSGDAGLAAEALDAGIDIDPALIPPEQIAAVSPAMAPQTPQF